MKFIINPEMAKSESSLNKTLRLKETMINKIQTLANENNISFNYLVTQMLQFSLDNLDDSEK